MFASSLISFRFFSHPNRIEQRRKEKRKMQNELLNDALEHITFANLVTEPTSKQHKWREREKKRLSRACDDESIILLPQSNKSLCCRAFEFISFYFPLLILFLFRLVAAVSLRKMQFCQHFE